MSEKRNRKKRSADDNPKKLLAKRIAVGCVIGIIAFFIMIWLTALAVVKAGLSDTIQVFLVFASAFLSAFLGAFSSCRLIKEKGLAMGIFTSLPIIFIICVILMITVKDIGLKTLLMAVLMIAGGGMGGVLAVNSKHR